MLEKLRKTTAYRICGYLYFCIWFFFISLPRDAPYIHTIAPNFSNTIDIRPILCRIVMMVFFLILASIAILTKPSKSKFDKFADIGCVLMLIAALRAPFDIPKAITYYIDKDSKLYAHREVCKIINKELPAFIKKTNANFTEEQLMDELSKNKSIYSLKLSSKATNKYNFSTIDFKYKAQNMSLFKSYSENNCNSEEDKCYLKLGVWYNKECKIYYDKKSITPTEKTLKFINDKYIKTLLFFD